MKFILITLIAFSSVSVFSQNTIGENKKIVDAIMNDNQVLIVLKDAVLEKKKKPSYFLYDHKSLKGPFKSVKIHYADPTFAIINDGKEEYVQWRNQKVFSAQKGTINISHIQLFPHNNQLIYLPYNESKHESDLLDFEGFLYSVTSEHASLIKKVVIKGQGIMSVSPDLDVLYSHGKGCIFKEIKSKNSLAVHFKNWIKTSDGYQPIWTQVEEGGPNGTYDVLYLGGKEILRSIAPIWEITLNADKTDFAAFGFEESNKPATLVTSKGPVGKYRYIENVAFDSQGILSFEYRDGETVLQQTGTITTKKGSALNYKVYCNDEKSDSILVYETTKNSERWVHKGKTVYEGLFYDCTVKTWSPQFGPVVGFVKNQQDIHYYINGEVSIAYKRIASFTEAENRHYAFSVYDEDGFYIITENQKYGPYPLIVQLYRSDNYVHVDSEGNIYYTVKNENEFIHYKNGKIIENQKSQSQQFFGGEGNASNSYTITALSNHDINTLDYTSLFDNFYHQTNLRYYVTGQSNDDDEEEEEVYEEPKQQIYCNSKVVASVSYSARIEIVKFNGQESVYVNDMNEAGFYTPGKPYVQGLYKDGWIVLLEKDQLKVIKDEN